MPLSDETAEWLRQFKACRVKFNEPMSRHTTFRVGGPAVVFLEPETPEALLALINGLGDRNGPFHVIGGGTNILVRDAGLSNPVIRLSRCLNRISVLAKTSESIWIEAGAGAKLHALCRFCMQKGYEGFNFASGIPGTVGGAIHGNAGTAAGWISEVLDSITLLTRTGKTVSLKKGQWLASYRRLKFDLAEQAENRLPIILSGIFRLKHGNPDALAKEAARLKNIRIQTQPIHLLSAGCIFKNPDSKQSAGMLIDNAELKGFQIGGARISEKHANFIINTGNATAEDILSLIESVREHVKKRFGIILETELIVMDE
ncbi:MAG: UDP-N-acetylmuramate dehydrogenase [Desulfatirhabdiaceae bacterium]